MFALKEGGGKIKGEGMQIEEEVCGHEDNTRMCVCVRAVFLKLNIVVFV